RVVFDRREVERLPELFVADPREQRRRADVTDACVLEVALEHERDLIRNLSRAERARHGGSPHSRSPTRAVKLGRRRRASKPGKLASHAAFVRKSRRRDSGVTRASERDAGKGALRCWSAI